MTQIIINETTPVVVEVSTPGPQGSSGTAIVGTVTTGASGSAAAVTNSGTPSAAVFNFTIPKGDIGDVTPAATAAKNAAEAAAIAAAASEIAAETAEQAAEDSATAALASANQASASASTAGTKAQEATDSASTAYSAAIAANLSRNVASAASTNANNKAAAALASADTASTKAQEASASEVVASTKAQEAVVSATTATNKATEASASAASALSAQQVTTDNATLAIAQANIAGAKAAAANTSANDALVQASVATAQAAEATTQANTATTQAGIATTQATTATTQAGIASTQANTAIAQAAIATTKASEASVSASNSQASASAALASQTASAASAAAANTSAGNASGSAASALAIYGTTAAQQSALTNAQSAASLAQGYALSASSAIQQDLSGVTAQALHRSPNAVTAMFVYDTSKDSDGGAWTEKCQHTSWYNEALNGKWLGAHDTEFQARNAGATLGIELSDTISNAAEWAVYGANTLEQDGTAVKVTYVNQQGGAYSFFRATKGLNTDLVVGKSYRVSFSAKVNAGSVTAGVSTSTAVNYKTTVASVAYQTYSVVFVATSATGDFFSFDALSSGEAVWVKDISVREVTALTTASGDYYQSTVDGKFYRLWKNLFTNSTLFNVSPWSKQTGVTATDNSVAAPDGSMTGCTLDWTACAVNQGLIGSGPAVNGLQNTKSIYVRADVAGGTVNLADPGNTIGSTTLTLSTTWQRISLSEAGQVNQAGVWLRKTASSPNIVYIAWGQLEYGSAATTYERKTTDGSITETFRGNKADFPRLAGIVAESANVTIYDLTEAGRPMWSRYVQSTVTSIAAINSEISVGRNGAINVYQFAKDRVYGKTQTVDVVWAQGIGSSAAHALTPTVLSAGTSYIPNNTINAVAMTVLPDAPVDAVTGLQVPTIAVATAGGVSVIKHNGTVVNSSSTGAYNSIALTPYALHTNAPGGSNLWNIAAPLSTLGASFALSGTLTQGQFASPDQATVKTVVPSRSRLFRMESNTSRMKIGNLNETGAFKSSAVSLSNTFNTGHLLGDIKRCFLADVDVGSVSGTELVVNGTFATDTDWTKYASTISGGTVNFDGVTSVTASIALLTQTTPAAVTAGKLYAITYTITSDTGNLISVGFGGTAPGVSRSAVGTYTDYVVAPSGTVNVTIITRGSVGVRTGSIDNISVREVVADRSYKAQAASITGTLTKTQVALGSQLVAYSGFSA